MAKKKSFNPFKMWGAYVGLILFLVIISFVPVLQGNFPDSTYDDFALYDVLTIGINLTLSGWIELISWVIGAGFVGFFVGWGVHSLVRSLK